MKKKAECDELLPKVKDDITYDVKEQRIRLAEYEKQVPSCAKCSNAMLAFPSSGRIHQRKVTKALFH